MSKLQKTSTKTFGVEALDRQRQVVRLTLTAASEQAVREDVRMRGLSIQRIYEFPLVKSFASVQTHTSPPGRPTFMPVVQGVECALPVPRRAILVGIGKGVIWGGIGAFATAGIIAMALERPLHVNAWLLWWGFFWGILSAFPLLQPIVGQEQIVVQNGTVTLKQARFRHRRTQYQLGSITNFRLITAGDSRRGRVLFDHDRETIQCWKHATLNEARGLITSLTDMIRYHCHSVECILFGHPPISLEPTYQVLQNPQVSDLTTPFFHLKEIAIHAKTYQFHQIEQFITYALNSLGQAYFKEHIEVYVFGDATKVHQNLRNTLTNLCKGVVFREEADLLTHFAPERLGVKCV